MNESTGLNGKGSSEKVAGASLAVAAALTVLVMAHHPTGTAQAATLGRAVHGALMALIIVMFAGFLRFAALRGLERFVVLVALAFYASATIGNLLAAAINGFVVPALLERGAWEENAKLLWTLNQTFAKGAVFAAAAAYALWGADLSLRGAGADRLVGPAGLAAGALPAALLAAGVLDMDVSGAFVIYGAQAAFAVLAGWRLATMKT